MNRDELRILLEKYEKQACTEKETALLDAFFESYTKPGQWRNWGREDVTTYEADLLADIKAGIQRSEKSPIYLSKSWHSQVKKWHAIAATLTLLAIAAVFLYRTDLMQKYDLTSQQTTISKTTQNGQKSTLVLSDGTTIRLNSGSELTFPETFEGNAREVTLTGEAFFDVTENATMPFIVHTKGLTTTVLGTSFNVNAYANKPTAITVATGKVRVTPQHPDSYRDKTSPDSYREPQHETLQPNEQVTYDNSTNEWIKKTVDITHQLAWTKGIIRFDDIPLREAMDILERWFNVSISFEYEATAHCTINGKYVDENLINILESIQYVKKTGYRFEEKNHILITGKACNP